MTIQNKFVRVDSLLSRRPCKKAENSISFRYWRRIQFLAPYWNSFNMTPESEFASFSARNQSFRFSLYENHKHVRVVPVASMILKISERRPGRPGRPKRLYGNQAKEVDGKLVSRLHSHVKLLHYTFNKSILL